MNMFGKTRDQRRASVSLLVGLLVAGLIWWWVLPGAVWWVIVIIFFLVAAGYYQAARQWDIEQHQVDQADDAAGRRK